MTLVDVATGVSDEEVMRAFAIRRRRQWGVFWLGFPALMVWLAGSSVAFALLVRHHPSWNSPILMAVLMLPAFVSFAVVAAWFTRKNLRCPACDAAIQLYGTRYYARRFNCPHCNRALSR